MRRTPILPINLDKTRVAILDDEDFWYTSEELEKVSFFRNLEALYHAVFQGDHFHVIIVDRYGFDFNADKDDIAKNLRDLGHIGKLVLFTSDKSNPPDGFDRVVSKDTLLFT